MKYEPLPHPSRRRPLKRAYVLTSTSSGIVARDEDGSAYVPDWEALREAVIFSTVPLAALQARTGYGWTVRSRRGRQIDMSRNGVTVRPVVHEGVTSDDVLALLAFLKERGVGPASLTTMARNSWRSTLAKPVSIHEMLTPKTRFRIGRPALIGGRKQALALPLRLSDVDMADMPAAYPAAMLAALPTAIQESPDPEWAEHGFAFATVTIAPCTWGPLPVPMTRDDDGITVVTYPTSGSAIGVWTFDELRLARDAGCDIELRRTWRSNRPRKLFIDWWTDIGLPLRKQSPLGKVLVNRLWSTFATDSTIPIRSVLRKSERDEVELPEETQPSIYGDDTAFLSSMIASRVRTRLYREGLSLPGAAYCDTDSVIVPKGQSPSGWVLKKAMRSVIVKGAQAYRWECNDCDVREWRSGAWRIDSREHLDGHFTMAGYTGDMARFRFDHLRTTDLTMDDGYDLGTASMPLGGAPNDLARRVKRATIR